MYPDVPWSGEILYLLFEGLKSPAVQIPATPYLKKLGFGTGVSVYLYQRSPKVRILSRATNAFYGPIFFNVEL